MDKRSLRRQNFGRLRELSQEQKHSHSEMLVTHLASHPLFLKAETVFSYAAMASEPDLDALRQNFPDKRWGLSRVADDGESLDFHEVAKGIALQESEYGFSEPDPQTSPIITDPDLILVPGVGFDPDSKARLGRGKGHYDRYLGPLMKKAAPPLVIGVCFSIQEIELMPEAHDVPMSFLATEAGII